MRTRAGSSAAAKRGVSPNDVACGIIAQLLSALVPREVSEDTRAPPDRSRLLDEGSRLSDVPVLIRAGTRRHVAALAENPASRHEHIPGTIDQPITSARHILTMTTVVAVKWPMSAKVVHRRNPVNMMGMAATTCSRNFDPAQSDDKKAIARGLNVLSDMRASIFAMQVLRATVAPPSVILSSAQRPNRPRRGLRSALARPAGICNDEAIPIYDRLRQNRTHCSGPQATFYSHTCFGAVGGQMRVASCFCFLIADAGFGSSRPDQYANCGVGLS